MNLRVQVDSDSAMNGGVTPDIRVPLNDTVMDPLYIDSVDVELQYAVKTLSSILGLSHPQDKSIEPGLEQNNPNPFSSTTTVTYRIQSDSYVILEFCDIYGRILQTLVSRFESSGPHTVTLDGSPFAAGIYLFRLKAGAGIVTRKCIID